MHKSFLYWYIEFHIDIFFMKILFIKIKLFYNGLKKPELTKMKYSLFYFLTVRTNDDRPRRDISLHVYYSLKDIFSPISTAASKSFFS